MKNKFMAEALKQAEIAGLKDEVPVGALVVFNQEIIGRAHNQNRANIDPTAHAEILALREAAIKIGSARLDDCDLYVTLEPCAMCAAAISLARIRNVFYACQDDKFGAVENGVKFFSSKSCYHKPEIYSGIGEDESRKMLQDFFKKKR